MKKFFFLLLLIFSFPSVYATSYTNYDTSYTFTIEDDSIDMGSYVDTSNHTLYEVLQSLVELDSSYYYIYSDYTSSSNLLRFYLIDKSDYAYLNFAYVGASGSSRSIFRYYTQDFDSFHRDFTDYNGDIYESQNYIDLKNCLINGGCITSLTSPSNGGDISRYSANYFGNNNNYSIDINYESYRLPLYSNIDLIYSTSIPSSSTYNFFFKSLSINDVLYSIGDKLPTYSDLFLSISDTFNTYSTSLNNIFVGSIPVANINNFNLSVKFNTFDSNYISNIRINPLYYGRVNHNDNYFTYEKINCSTSSISSFAINDLFFNGVIYPSGFFCTSDLSSYDYIYIRLEFFPLLDFDTSIYNLNLQSNYGNVYKVDSYDTSRLGLEIYEDFKNLSSDFSILLSSNRSCSRYYFVSSNNFLQSWNFSKSDNTILDFSNVCFGTVNNSNKLLYNNPRLYDGLTDIKLFIDSETMLSLSNNYTVYYYDDNNTVSSDIISPVDINVVVDNSYDISYYFNIVNSYIDSLSSDLYQLHDVLQQGYNLIPEPFSALILILFILSCLHLILKLIRSD